MLDLKRSESDPAMEIHRIIIGRVPEIGPTEISQTHFERVRQWCAGCLWQAVDTLVTFDESYDVRD